LCRRSTGPFAGAEHRSGPCQTEGSIADIPASSVVHCDKSLLLLYAVSVLTAFFGWYACGPIANRSARCVTRASVIAFLCAPGLVVGHGFAVVPTVYALAVQPSVFTAVPIGIVWLVTLGLVFGVPVLRRHENGWPPSPRELFVDGYIGKYVLFGLVCAATLGAALYAGETPAIKALQYALLVGGAALSFDLCFQASRLKNANSVVTPALFSVPVFFVGAAPALVLWYGAGVTGALVARGRGRIATWTSTAVFALLAANFIERSYRAFGAPPHVRIQGGVAGNVAFAALCVVFAAVSWWLLRRYGTGRSSPPTRAR
jgi:hypothetical protein